MEADEEKIRKEEGGRMGKIRVAIIGVGNCAASLVQGVEFYKDAPDSEFVPGLMHVRLGGYHVGDVEFSAAFDVDANKVGKDLSEAIVTPPNNTYKICDVPKLGVKVMRGVTKDGLGKYYKSVIKESDEPPVNVAEVLKDTKTDVVVNYLPVGSEEATRWYMEQAIEAGCAVVNCIPVFIAKDPLWQERFRKANLPIVGDDVKAQIGSTIVHRVLAKLFNDRGVRLDRTYQLNVGGNMDFMNMLERERLMSKKVSKTEAVTSQISHQMDPDNVHIGPSDYVPWLLDRKIGFIRLEGTEFGNVPLSIELRLEVWDSPNSAGIVIDAIRCAKLALDAGIGGPLIGPSAYLMKSPPVQYPDPVAKEMVEKFIEEAMKAAGRT